MPYRQFRATLEKTAQVHARLISQLSARVREDSDCAMDLLAHVEKLEKKLIEDQAVHVPHGAPLQDVYEWELWVTSELVYDQSLLLAGLIWAFGPTEIAKRFKLAN